MNGGQRAGMGRQDRWLVVGVPPRRRFGWEIRAGRIFEQLAHRVDAAVMHRPAPGAVLRSARTHPRHLLPHASIAATTLMPGPALAVAERLMRLEVVDLHDHAILQRRTLGFEVTPAAERAHRRLLASHLQAFRSVAVPTPGLAEVAGISAEQRIVVPNGTDATSIRPGPWPHVPVVAMVSGGAPGRGIEMLIDAVAIVREAHPDVALRLALAPTDRDSRRYIQALRDRTSRLPWVSLREVPPPELSGFLADATVVAVPHPPGPYMDLALPVKLFDAMAAGRPVCVTPRSEMAAVVRRTQSGSVARGDGVADYADALDGLLASEGGARALGENGRRAAVAEFDWRHLSATLADEVLRRATPASR